MDDNMWRYVDGVRAFYANTVMSTGGPIVELWEYCASEQIEDS